MKAFTLIEVLITSLILCIAITGMLMSFVYTQRIITDNIHKFNAGLALNQSFENIQSKNIPVDVDAYIAGSPYTYKFETTKDNLQEYIVTLTLLSEVETANGMTLKHIQGTVKNNNKIIMEAETLSSIEE